MPYLKHILVDNQRGNTRARVLGIYGILLIFNLAVWFWTLVVFHPYPLLLGTAILAYSLGLRHAVDADHIAAIDNVTRKLMQEGKRPMAIGFFFSLGHSPVVVLATVAIAVTTTLLQSRFAWFHEVGGIVGTSVSALFLFAVALANIVILLSVYRTFARVRRGGRLIESDLDILLSQRGLLGRLFRPLFGLIGRSW